MPPGQGPASPGWGTTWMYAVVPGFSGGDGAKNPSSGGATAPATRSNRGGSSVRCKAFTGSGFGCCPLVPASPGASPGAEPLALASEGSDVPGPPVACSLVDGSLVDGPTVDGPTVD